MSLTAPGVLMSNLRWVLDARCASYPFSFDIYTDKP
jgi:hypothetical protein